MNAFAAADGVLIPPDLLDVDGGPLDMVGPAPGRPRVREALEARGDEAREACAADLEGAWEGA